MTREMNNSRPLILVLLLVLAVSCSQPKSDVDKRVDSLLRQMTLQEKIGQMNQISAGGDVSNYAGAIREGQIGSILNEVDLKVLASLLGKAPQQVLNLGRTVINWNYD